MRNTHLVVPADAARVRLDAQRPVHPLPQRHRRGEEQRPERRPDRVVLQALARVVARPERVRPHRGQHRDPEARPGDLQAQRVAEGDDQVREGDIREDGEGRGERTGGGISTRGVKSDQLRPPRWPGIRVWLMGVASANLRCAEKGSTPQPKLLGITTIGNVYLSGATAPI